MTYHGASGTLAVILLELAAGSLGVLWLTPVWGVVKRGFFLLVGWTVLVSAFGAALIDGAPAGLNLFAACSLAFVVALHLKAMRFARVIGIAGSLAGLAAILAVAGARGDTGQAVAAMVTGAAFLGATWVGMLLGHWYLVDRGLSLRPMKAYALAFSISIGLALVSAALAKRGNPATAEAGLNPLLYVSGLTLYLAFGLVAVNALLAFFVHKLVDEGSIRAATGMLYLAVIMALAAEFAAKARFFT